MFGWLKKLFAKQDDILQVKMVGHPIHFNVPPESRTAQARHLGRICRLVRAARDERDADRLAAFKDEIAARKAELARVGITVPSTLEECEQMFEVLSNG